MKKMGSGAADKAAVRQVSDDETSQVLSCQLSAFGHVVMPEFVIGNGASTARWL